MKIKKIFFKLIIQSLLFFFITYFFIESQNLSKTILLTMVMAFVFLFIHLDELNRK